MSVRTKHRIEFGFAGTLLILSFLVLKGSRVVGQTGTDPIACYGGSLSPQNRSALERMNRELREARDVLEIGSRRVLILDGQGRVSEYRFSDSALWKDESPFVTGVLAFHFEFRDEWGNLLTHRSENCECVRSAAYTVRINDRRSEVFAVSKTNLPFNESHQDDFVSSSLAAAR
jgi:hypothetical protein